jgi:hypothetical protein
MNAARLRNGLSLKTAVLAAGTFAVLGWVGESRVAAQPINPQVFKKQFEEARKDAEVVAVVRVLSASCTEAKGEGKARSVTLELALQVVRLEKGAVKQGDILVVAHKVNLPAGPGPGAYGYMGAVRRFPFVPGVRGDVALRWDAERRRYVGIAGWVEMPNLNSSAIPTQVGMAYVAGDAPAPK